MPELKRRVSPSPSSTNSKLSPMASIPFHLYPTLLLLLAQLAHATPPQPSTTYIIHANHLAKPPHFADLEQWYHSMVAAHSPRASAASTSSGRILYVYDTVMHGFAVQLTGEEARRMSKAPGVTSVEENRILHLLTTRSPGFLGLDPGFGAWKDTDFDGVIIGFIDSGIWPESPSFNDSGLGPVRSSWKGGCVDATDFNASLCNNKIVGAKSFITGAEAMGSSIERNGVPSPRDTFGHGTHVASTAAGAEVHDIGFLGFARGTARGVAPKARVTVYQVNGSSSSTADVVAAMDAAVKDGVDIISISLGYDLQPFHSDGLAVATFGAVRQGVFVVLAGGNFGPKAYSVINAAPWVTTVGAATVDRMFPAKMKLGDGSVLTGVSLYTKKANGSTMSPLVASSCRKEDLTPDKIMGSIVVCFDGEAIDREVRNAGGVGKVVVDKFNWFADGEDATDFTIPALTLSRAAGDQLRAYMDSVPYPVASLRFSLETAIGESRAPMVVDFLSRGPNPIVPELLKPDVVAPGQGILAAWKGDYAMESGTSMACPHVAGVSALIKKKYPSWTPAMIRSAIMTTAARLDNTDREIIDNAVTDGNRGATAATPFAAGAGHVRPQLALDPGLVYDAGEHDYISFLCSLNYTAEQMRVFVPDFVKCMTTLPGGPAGLNYPSFVVVFDNNTDVRTLTRTVTSVSEKAETYKVTVATPEQVKVTVMPTTLEFKKQKERKSYTIEFRSLEGRNVTARWDFGHIVWENNDHQVRSPVAFQWKKY